MSGLAVLSQALPVIGRDDHHRVLEQAEPLQLAPEPADLLVDVGDLSLVQVGAKALRERGRRVVGGMGVEIVHEQEEWLAQGAGRRRGRAGDRGGVSLRDRQSHRADGILVALEPAVEPVLAIEHRGADDRRRVVARLGQEGGEGRRLVRHPIDAVVTNAMPVGEQPAHQRGVRGQRDGYGCDGVLEDDAFGGPAVQVGSGGAPTAVAAEPIRPGRVDADQEHRRLRARLARPPGRGS